MSHQFQFELVSPEELIISKAVTMVTVPGGEGDYGVLAGHSPLITTVRPGVIEVYDLADSILSERIFVAGGFAEVTNERCTVVAEEAVMVSDLKRSDVEAEIKSLADDLATSRTDADRAAVEAELAIAHAKFHALSQG